MAKEMTALERRCEDCANCITKKGVMCCSDLWDRPCNEVEADECPEEIMVEEVEEIQEKTKDVKIDHGAKADVREKKERKPRERKPDPTKEGVISALAEFLVEYEGIEAESVKITNVGKIIEFNLGETHYKLDLIRQRKPKTPK